jgi:hypothetical protein
MKSIENSRYIDERTINLLKSKTKKKNDNCNKNGLNKVTYVITTEHTVYLLLYFQ